MARRRSVKPLIPVQIRALRLEVIEMEEYEQGGDWVEPLVNELQKRGVNLYERAGIEGAEEKIEYLKWRQTKVHTAEQETRSTVELSLLAIIEDAGDPNISADRIAFHYVGVAGMDETYDFPNIEHHQDAVKIQYIIDVLRSEYLSWGHGDGPGTPLTIADPRQEYQKIKAHIAKAATMRDRSELLWNYTGGWKAADLLAVLKAGLETEFPYYRK